MENGALWIILREIVGGICSLLSSSFGVALAGAGVGAFWAGAVTKRLKEFDDAHFQLKLTNAATGLSATICNAYLGIKNDFVIGFRSNFYAELDAYEKKPADRPFVIQYDFRKLSQEPVGSERLEHLIFENIGSDTSTLHFTIALLNSMKNVSDILKQRNAYIDGWAAHTLGWDEERKARRYLGKASDLKDVVSIDEDYKNSIDYLHAQVDDCIHFSEFLHNALHAHAVELKKELEKRRLLSFCRKPKPVKIVRKWDFTAAKLKGLFPQESEYEALHKGFGHNLK